MALLRLHEGVLMPVVADGLVPDTLSCRFMLAEHPRLAHILQSSGPVRFTGSALPTPLDGLLVAGEAVLSRVHAYMDALDTRAVDHLSDDTVARLAALAAAAMRTAGLIETLERVLAPKEP